MGVLVAQPNPDCRLALWFTTAIYLAPVMVKLFFQNKVSSLLSFLNKIHELQMKGVLLKFRGVSTEKICLGNSLQPTMNLNVNIVNHTDEKGPRKMCVHNCVCCVHTEHTLDFCTNITCMLPHTASVSE